MPTLGFCARPWQRVAGPVGASTLPLKAVGWVASPAFSWMLLDGASIDIRFIAHSSVVRLLQPAIEAALWKRWAIAPSGKNEDFVRDPNGYWLPDVRRLCSGQGKDWTALQASCLHSIVCGSQWPQNRLYLAGFLDSRDWQACSGWHKGTVAHRNWNSRSLSNDRGQGISQDNIGEARGAL